MKGLRQIARSVATCALALAAMGATGQATPPEGRLLASNCFQCHGTTGRGGFEEIAGKSPSEIYSKLKEMQRVQPGSGDHNIMIPHAKGFTDAQLRKISEYFAGLR
jgi:cytochrome subunit of sulfide dehydrogenase